MFTRVLSAVCCFALVGAFAPAQTPKPADPKAPPKAAPAKEAGQVDPKQFKEICEKADVVVIGKAFAIKTAELDSEPPTPVYTTAQIETKGMKFLKGREKVGGKPEARVAEAFAGLSQAAALLMGKTVIVAFKWDGKAPKLMMLSITNATDLGMILEKFPDAK